MATIAIMAVLGSMFALPAHGQFICSGSTNGAEPQNGAGATAAGSADNFGCGPNANASGIGSANTAIGFSTNASGNSSANTAIGKKAKASGAKAIAGLRLAEPAVARSQSAAPCERAGDAGSGQRTSASA